jgi:hypothetical protein
MGVGVNMHFNAIALKASFTLALTNRNRGVSLINFHFNNLLVSKQQQWFHLNHPSAPNA